MLRLLGRLLGSCAVVALLFIACRDGATGPGLPRTVSLSLTPRFQAGAESALPVNRIRITAYRVLEAPQQGLDPTPLATSELAVDPTDETWQVALDVPVLGGAPLRVQATLELINVAGGGTSSVEWAARTGILTVVAGRDVTQDDLLLGRGPLPNLDIEDVFIGEFPSSIVRGDSIDLTATLEPEVAGSRLYWSSLDEDVATIDDDGRVRSLTTGTVRIAATAGFHADTITVTVIDPSALVDFLSVQGGDGQTATVGTAVALPVRVGAYDRGENPLAGVPITFTVTAGGGTITGPTTIVTGANGLATLGGWTLGTTAGANVITATVAGTQLSETITATGTAGPAQNVVLVSGNNQSGSAGVALAQPLVVRVRDQFNNPVQGVTVAFRTTGGGSFLANDVVSEPDGLAQTAWTPGFTTTTQTATATATGVTAPVTFTATVTLPPPQVQLAIAGTDKVGVGLTQAIDVTLPTPAPAGGATVTLANGNTAVLSLAATTLTFAAGQTAQSVNATGLAEGTAGITATSPQFQTGTLNVPVELRVIGTPTSVNVPYGQTASLPINIPRPAPAGGITVQVTSSDPSRVSVAQAGIVIPAGGTTGSATLNGVLPGPAQVVVAHPFYVWDTTAVTTTASLDILNTSYTINQSFGATTPVRFLSNNVPVPAPAPGVAVNVVSRNPACVEVTASTITIPTGLTEASLSMRYPTSGGTTTFPCTTRVVVSTATTGIAFDSATVTMNATPTFVVTDASLGQGLQRSWSATLGASNHGGVTVRITSPEPTQVLVARSSSEVGAEFIDIPTVNGTTQVNFVVQALDGARVGAYAIRASAPGFVDDAGTATVVTPALEVISVTTNPTSLSGDDDFYVRVGVPEGQLRFLNEVQSRRWGGAPLVATATVSDPAVIQVVNAAGAAGTTGTAQIAEGQSNTPTQRTSGGMAIRPVANGTATVTASIPGIITTSSNGTVSVTVTTPGISAGGAIVGAGLQRAMNVTLLAPAPTGGVTVRIASSDANVLRVAPNATTAGTDFIDVAVAAGGQSFTYYVQGVEGQAGAPALTVSAPGYTTARPTVNVVTPGIEVLNVNTSTTTLTGDNPIYSRIGVPEGQNRFLNEIQSIRAGGTPVTITFSSGTPTVGTLLTAAGAQGGTATATIPIGASNTPTTVASGGVAIRPLSAGTTRIDVGSTGLITTSLNGTATVTITQPTQSPGGNITVGSGLQRNLGGNLQASSHGGVTVRLTSSDPSRVLLATSSTATAAAFIDIPLANGVASYSYYVHAVEEQTGTATITATTPGFANGTSTVTVVTPSLEIINLQTTTTTLTGNNTFYIRIGVPEAQNRFLNEVQSIRTGGVPVTTTVTTSSPGVAQLVPSSTNGATATVTIPVGQSNTPTSGAGAVALDPLTAGTTTVTVASAQARTTTTNGTVTVTVSAPALSISTGTLGSGLQRAASVQLGAPAPAGGLTVRLTSSQPSVVILSATASGTGSGTIDLTIPAGGTSATFYSQALDGQTGTPTIQATAPGFSDGTIAQAVVAPALEIISLGSAILASAPNAGFYVRVGVANANNQFLNEVLSRRGGGTPLTVTATNSNATVAQLVVIGSATGQSVNAAIAPGVSNTPTSGTGSFAFDPQSAGSTTVTATIPGFNTTINNGVVNVTVQAGLIQAAISGALR